MPTQPANPMAVKIEKMITTSAANVPLTLRVVNRRVRITIKNIKGVKVVASEVAASKNAAFSIVIPDR